MKIIINPQLSEFVGAIIGDGCLYGNFNKYVIMLTGSIKYDNEYYQYFQKILSDMGVNSVLKIHGGLRLVIQNKKLFQFLQNELGMKYKGKKTLEVEIPRKILMSEKNLKACLRGLFNTDGSIFTADKPGSPNYPSIEFTTVSKNLSSQLVEILRNFGFRARLRFYDPKVRKYKRTYKIALNGYEMVNKWYYEMGVSHPIKGAKFYEILMGRAWFEHATHRSSAGLEPRKVALPG